MAVVAAPPEQPPTTGFESTLRQDERLCTGQFLFVLCREEVRVWMRESEVYQQQCAQLRAELDRVHQEHAACTTTHTQLELYLQRAQSETGRLQDALDEAQSERDDLRDRLEHATHDCDRLTQRNDALTARMTQELQVLRKRLDERASSETKTVRAVMSTIRVLIIIGVVL